MEDALQLSFILQAIAICGLAVAIALLVRNLRYLHSKLPAAGALMLSGGLRVGDSVPAVTADSLSGKSMQLGEDKMGGRGALLFFFSPTCPVSQAMLPVVQSFGQEHKAQFRTVFATDGHDQGHSDVAKRYGLAKDDYTVSEALGMTIGVGRVPQAVLLDEDGRVRARGLINTREHLESLLNARDTQTATLQSFLAQQSA
jgi:methylamine dehydrogenase accessory protein MauD